MSEETKTAAPPKLQVGLPEGVDPEKVRVRMTTMIANGTQPVFAQQLAIDAEQAQAVRDAAYKKLDEERKAGLAAAAKAASKGGK